MARRKAETPVGESAEPAVESVAGAGIGGGTAEVDETSASPATPPVALVTPSGEDIAGRDAALAWLDGEFETTFRKLDSAALGVLQALLRLKSMRLAVASGNVVDARSYETCEIEDVRQAIRG